MNNFTNIEWMKICAELDARHDMFHNYLVEKWNVGLPTEYIKTIGDLKKKFGVHAIIPSKIFKMEVLINLN